jgi:hypothetical protein
VTVGRPPHFALLRAHEPARRLARRLERSAADTAADDRRALLTYWFGSGASHLRAEEHVLLEAWNRHGGANHPLNVSVRDELSALSRRVAAVAADPRSDSAELRSIGSALAAHLKRQERELCDVVERAVPPDELAAVDETLADLRRF